jgi:hypothetical protein
VSERRAPFIAIQTDIRKDERVNVIADVAGYNCHEAMGEIRARVTARCHGSRSWSPTPRRG